MSPGATGRKAVVRATGVSGLCVPAASASQGPAWLPSPAHTWLPGFSFFLDVTNPSDFLCCWTCSPGACPLHELARSAVSLGWGPVGQEGGLGCGSNQKEATCPCGPVCEGTDGWWCAHARERASCVCVVTVTGTCHPEAVNPPSCSGLQLCVLVRVNLSESQGSTVGLNTGWRSPAAP